VGKLLVSVGQVISFKKRSLTDVALRENLAPRLFHNMEQGATLPEHNRALEGTNH